MNSTTSARLALATVLFLLMITACSNDDTGKNDSSVIKFNFGQLIAINITGEARISSIREAESLEVKVASISDSRCPSDVLCIWEGRVDVTFKIDGVNEPISLCLGYTASCNNSHEFILGKKHYLLILKDVTPYPSTANGNVERMVTFIVEVI